MMRKASRHRISGRIGNAALAGLAIIAFVLIGGIALFGRPSITQTANQFMSALASHDAKTLTELSVLSTDPPETIQKKWEESLALSKHYIFTWSITSANTSADGKNGAVKLSVTRNANSGASYEENFALPMVFQYNKWKVRADGISREMFPFLPRAGKR